jgi:Skp family chaperone for outer membrane proteins
VGLRVQLSRVEAELSELLREAHELRAQLTDDGPMDSADRSAIITQAEQLEALADELQRRREELLEQLGKSR